MAIQSKYSHSGPTDAGADGSATVCNLTPSQTARITQHFQQSLIASVVGKRIHPRQLALRLRTNLRLAGDLDVFDLGLGFFVLKFSNASDYYEALEERPWSIPHLCVYVFPWLPNFKPSEALIPFVDVWIRLPELSIEYYDEEIFGRIAETIGCGLVKIDQVTQIREKCMFARICVRISLCNPLVLSIRIDGKQQEIVYEGLDLLCPVCRHVHDLKLHCLSNPSGSTHHRAPPLHPIGPSSKKRSIPCESSRASALGSRFQALEEEPLLVLKMDDWPRLETVAKQKGKCEVTLPNLPKQSSTKTMKAPKLNQTNSIQSRVVKDQSMAEKTNNPATLPVHNNGQQPSSSAVKSFPPLQPCSALETSLKFFSTATQQSTAEKEIINTPSEGLVVDSCPTVYTVDPTTITSIAIGLSEVAATTTRTNQNQFAISFVPTLRSENEDTANLETVSKPASCSKKMLCWNFPGTDNAKLTRALKDLIQLHEPSVMLIFGSKISGADADQVAQNLAFDGSYCRKPDGYNGGVWLLLSRQDVQIEVSSYSPQQVSASVHFHSKTAVVGRLNADIVTSSGRWGQTFRCASMAC